MSQGRKFCYITGLIIERSISASHIATQKLNYAYKHGDFNYNFQWRIQDFKKGGATVKELLSGKLLGIVCDSNSYTLFVA